MTFTSLYFFAFVLAALILYYALPKNYRWIVLLVASVVFYSICSFKYIEFIIFTALSTFLGALWIQSVSQKTKVKVKENKEVWTLDERKAYKQKQVVNKRLILALILVLNFGILFVLKYSNFLVDSIGSLFGLEPIDLGLVLPLGISFYTFQAIGYIVDVYREKIQPQRNFAKFSLFISFFPQIIQGPIASYDDLSNQLIDGHTYNFDNIKYGSYLILWGLFKKLIIADRLVIFINIVINDYTKYNGLMILLSALMYAVQLYGDFSGGIDIARGVARMFGIVMAENFRRPYFSKSISEYWRRWHISLGLWMKNYVFFSITLSKPFIRLGKITKKKLSGHIGKVLPGSIATFIVFLLIGIWHGANWKYIGFGFWNAIIIFLSNLLEPVFEEINITFRINKKSKCFKTFQMGRTFLIVLIGYYFDIAPDFVSALDMIRRSITDINVDLFKRQYGAIGFNYVEILVIIFVLLFWLIVSIMQEKQKLFLLYNNIPMILRMIIVLGLVISILLFGVYGPGYNALDFVYMQF